MDSNSDLREGVPGPQLPDGCNNGTLESHAVTPVMDLYEGAKQMELNSTNSNGLVTGNCFGQQSTQGDTEGDNLQKIIGLLRKNVIGLAKAIYSNAQIANAEMLANEGEIICPTPKDGSFEEPKPEALPTSDAFTTPVKQGRISGSGGRSTQADILRSMEDIRQKISTLTRVGSDMTIDGMKRMIPQLLCQIGEVIHSMEGESKESRDAEVEVEADISPFLVRKSHVCHSTPVIQKPQKDRWLGYLQQLTECMPSNPKCPDDDLKTTIEGTVKILQEIQGTLDFLDSSLGKDSTCEDYGNDPCMSKTGEPIETPQMTKLVETLKSIILTIKPFTNFRKNDLFSILTCLLRTTEEILKGFDIEAGKLERIYLLLKSLTCEMSAQGAERSNLMLDLQVVLKLAEGKVTANESNQQCGRDHQQLNNLQDTTEICSVLKNLRFHIMAMNGDAYFPPCDFHSYTYLLLLYLKDLIPREFQTYKNANAVLKLLNSLEAMFRKQNLQKTVYWTLLQEVLNMGKNGPNDTTQEPKEEMEISPKFASVIKELQEHVRIMNPDANFPSCELKDILFRSLQYLVNLVRCDLKNYKHSGRVFQILSSIDCALRSQGAEDSWIGKLLGHILQKIKESTNQRAMAAQSPLISCIASELRLHITRMDPNAQNRLCNASDLLYEELKSLMELACTQLKNYPQASVVRRLLNCLEGELRKQGLEQSPIGKLLSELQLKIKELGREESAQQPNSCSRRRSSIGQMPQVISVTDKLRKHILDMDQDAVFPRCNMKAVVYRVLLYLKDIIKSQLLREGSVDEIGQLITSLKNSISQMGSGWTEIKSKLYEVQRLLRNREDACSTRRSSNSQQPPEFRTTEQLKSTLEYLRSLILQINSEVTFPNCDTISNVFCVLKFLKELLDEGISDSRAVEAIERLLGCLESELSQQPKYYIDLLIHCREALIYLRLVKEPNSFTTNLMETPNLTKIVEILLKIAQRLSPSAEFSEGDVESRIFALLEDLKISLKEACSNRTTFEQLRKAIQCLAIEVCQQNLANSEIMWQIAQFRDSLISTYAEVPKTIVQVHAVSKICIESPGVDAFKKIMSSLQMTNECVKKLESMLRPMVEAQGISLQSLEGQGGQPTGSNERPSGRCYQSLWPSDQHRLPPRLPTARESPCVVQSGQSTSKTAEEHPVEYSGTASNPYPLTDDEWQIAMANGSTFGGTRSKDLPSCFTDQALSSSSHDFIYATEDKRNEDNGGLGLGSYDIECDHIDLKEGLELVVHAYMWSDPKGRIASRKTVRISHQRIIPESNTTEGKMNEEATSPTRQFNCSAEVTEDGADTAQCPGDPATRTSDCTAALIKLLEDLKATLLDSTKTRNPNIRESTIASVETVLNQIRARLNEPLIGASLNERTSGASKSHHSDVSTVLREVEKSIRSLKEGSHASNRGSSPSVRPPSLKVNSIDVPTEAASPSSTRKSGSSRGSKPYSAKEDITSMKTHSTQQRPTSTRSHTSSRRSSPTPQDSPSGVGATRTSSVQRSRGSGKSAKSPRSQQIASENVCIERTSSVPKSGSPERSSRRSSKRHSGTNDSISSKAASEPQITDRECPVICRSGSAGGRLSHESGQCLETGSRKSTFSKILSSLRSHSPRSSRTKHTSSRSLEPVEICARLLTICGAAQEGSPLATCSPEALYEKLLSMGPEGAQFLQDAQDYINSTRSQQRSGASYPSKRSISKVEAPEQCYETSRRSGDQTLTGRATDMEILDVLKDVRESMQNLTLKQESMVRSDPEVLDLLLEMRESLQSPRECRESEICDCEKCFAASDHITSRKGTTTTKRSTMPADLCEQEFRTSRMTEPMGSFMPMSSMRSARFSMQPPECIENPELRNTLNEIRQSIQTIENRDPSSPGPEVLNMLTEVRDSIRTLSNVQQDSMQTKPEVLCALEEIRETITNVEERNQAAQEQANRDMMSMLNCVRESIRTVEATNNERSEMKNQQLLDTLNDMRQSVSRLEMKSAMSERSLNPRVASLLSDIRSSIRTMETARASQRSAADSSMMDVLKDIKHSLVSIEGKQSTTSQRPSVNMFVLGGSKKSAIDGLPRGSCDIPTLGRTTSKFSMERFPSQINPDVGSMYEPRSTMPPQSQVTATDPYVKEALDEIRQSVQQIKTDSQAQTVSAEERKYSEMRESIQVLKEDMRSFIERQTQVTRESGAAQIQGLSCELADIRSGMKSLIDTIPTIVEAARSEAISERQTCRSPSSPPPARATTSKHRLSSVESPYDDEEHSPICRKVLQLLEEMRAESAMEKEVLRCVQTSPEPPIGGTGGSMSAPPAALWRTEPTAAPGVAPSCASQGTSVTIPVTSPNQLPSTFTLSFVGAQPQALDTSQPLVININGRTFRCSKM